jgi:hypothetical protein
VGKGGEGTQIISTETLGTLEKLYYTHFPGEADPTTEAMTENGSKTNRHDKMPALLTSMSIPSFSILVFYVIRTTLYPCFITVGFRQM